jgi:hypothetical protein
MTSTPSDPKDIAIFIVQGSFHTPHAYQKLRDGLQHLGYSAFHPGLPSCSNIDSTDFPTGTLHDDSAAVKRVFVIMHSYGGLVGSNAISQELSFAHRKSSGLSGDVVHLFYIAAFVLDKGQSVLGTFGESPNNDVRVSQNNVSTIQLNAEAKPDLGSWTFLPQERIVVAVQ